MVCTQTIHCFRTFCTSKAIPRHYDIVIVGGGLVGSAMACAIGRQSSLSSKKVLLLDSLKTVQPKVRGDNWYGNRVSAIAPSSVELFENLNVWKQISIKAQPVSALYIADGCSESRITFEQSKPNSPVAYIIENWRIVNALHQCLRESLNVDWRQETSFCELSLPENLNENVVLKLNNGEIVESSLLIAADGANSKVREISGLKYTNEDYGQSCIVGTLEISPSENNIKNTIAWQRFMPNGPIGILPLNETLSSLAWTTSTSEAKHLLELPNEEFVKELNGALVDRSGHNQIINGPLDCFSSLLNLIPFLESSNNFLFPTILSLPNNDRAAFPLTLIHAHDYIGNRLALIGDAAHRIHPMAGLGVNLGWSDVINLTNTLEMTVKEGGDLGSLIYLNNFDTKSQRRNVPIMTAIDILNSLFSTNFLPSVLIRSIGVNLLDRLWPAKDLIVQFTS